MAEKTERESRALSPWDPFRDLDLFERWSPFREFGSFSSRLAHLMEERSGERLRQVLSPPVDISESDDAYTITVEVPGVKKDDLTIDIQEGVLSSRGEKRIEREEKKDKGRRLERSYGSFCRSFSLPSNADADCVKAKFHDGVLTITLPKTAESKPTTIVVQS